MKPSNRDKLLAQGMRVVHELGYSGASVRDIARAADVPLSSFTSHFASKEAYCLEILELYYLGTAALIERTLRNDALAPLQRLRDYFDRHENVIEANGVEHGCLMGNFSVESAAHSETIRLRLTAMFADIEGAIAYALDAAVAVGELAPIADSAGLAAYLVASFQGAILRAKVEHNPIHLQRYKELLFSRILT